MKVGVMLSFIAPPGDQEAAKASLRELPELLPLAESLGYESFHVGEHHFMEDGWCPQPLIALAAAAGLTKRMRLVSDVLLLPLADPIRIAEEVATLDCISGGRVTLGLAPGYVSEEFEAFGVPREQRFARFEEGIDVMQKLWAGGGEAHRGEFFEHPAMTLSPLPVQSPLPILYGVSGPQLLRRAAKRGVPVAASPRHGAEEVLEHQRIYDQAAAEFGTSCEERPVIKEVVVAPTRAEAEELAAPAIETAFRLYAEKSAAGERDLRNDQGEVITARNPISFETIRSRCLVGTPDEVAEQAEALVTRLRITELVCCLQLPGLPPAAVKQSLELFAQAPLGRLIHL